MRRTLLAAIVAALVPASPAAAAPAEPLKIMVVGDSLSHGVGGDWTWRNWLWREFRDQQTPVDFVGPRRGVTSGYGTRYERTWPWDDDHAALSGSFIGTHQNVIANEMSTYDPDVVTVLLGTNNAIRGDSAAAMAAELQTLVGTILDARPGTRVLLGEIPNVGIPERDQRTADVNEAMASWAAGKLVTIAHNRTASTLPWSPEAHTFDDIHANATGQTLIAHRFAQAAYLSGILPDPPQVYLDRVWSPLPVPTVTRSGNTLTVGWKQTTCELGVQTVRVVVDGSVKTPWISVPGRCNTQTVNVDVSAGSHRVQIAVGRGRMVSAPGTSVTA